MSVTGTDCCAGETIESGNTLAELEAQAMQALGVTGADSATAGAIERRNADRARWRLELKARKSADVCGKCGGDLGPRESVYIACVWAGYLPLMGGYSRRNAPVCEGCAPPSMKGEGRFYRPDRGRCERRPCDTCERPVVWRPTRRDHYRRHVFCCERCEWTHHNGARNARVAAEREKVRGACGEAFTASRRDARTCSPACKQKAYRRRKGAA